MHRNQPRPRPTRERLPALQSLERRVLFAAGDLDTTFGGDGIAAFDYKAHDFTGDVAVQADGKVVVAGVTDGLNAANEDFLVVRFNADGSLDTTFGGGDGFVVTDFGRRDSATAVHVLSDGRILVAGGSEENGTIDYRYALARYTAAGAPDPTFGGGDGMVDLQMRGTARDMAIQPDGKIVLSGNAEFRLFGLARFNPNGSVDTTFGTGGKVTTDFNEGGTVANEVEIAPDGKIVAAGSFNRGFNRGVVSRYLPDGRIDTSFSGDGKFWVEDESPIIEGMLVQGDGKIVVLEWDFTLRRIRAGGGYDSTFGNNGVARLPVEGSESDFSLALDLDRQADGKLIATGTVNTGDEGHSAIGRLTPDGQIDTTFGGDGVVTVQGAADGNVSAYAPLVATTLAPDGKIVSGGRSISPGPGPSDFLYDLLVYRFQNDGPVEPPPTGGDVTVQAENGGPFTGASVSRSNSGYTGSGYLDFAADSGGSATWDVAGLQGPGEYVVEFRYANGSSARTLQFEATPGTPAKNVSFAPTGAWTNWSTVSVPATVGGAGNSLAVVLRTIGQNGPNIDSLTVRKVGTTPPPTTGSTFQAEQATVVGAQVASNTQGYTGSGFVDFLHGAGDSVEWSFNDAGGSRTLSFRYANGSSDRPLELRVNGQVINPRLSFAPTGSWNTWREVSVTVDLAAGNNRVKLTSIGSNGGNIDALTVR